ncbi:hypothetical protein A11A3_06415 [Alcanivorax hongdengensis A-11-3]|uniref:Uncharacterized protein n=1 Tax=Alcanivorax hongdengensis A-11-3 TaxID=1177179 RepID=L0WCW9_9GAMM|nr:hypothetical protein [Alcanivorax hongdengensis]EKF74844.1 hypothetical protein A11A3_06415 [Alcanivorax hongdengensis A-11-3]
MSQELSRRRRAIITGLSPFMEERLLLEAISLWQDSYADRPRFSLQGFVSELCRLFDLADRRHHIHMSLVQAMSLPVSELQADPWSQSQPDSPERHPCTQAFQLLQHAIWQRLGEQQASQLRLDMLAQLRQKNTPAQIRLVMESWLQHPQQALSPLDIGPLRTQLNRAYVLLCERIGPVEADRLLKQAYDSTAQHNPGLQSALRELL